MSVPSYKDLGKQAKDVLDESFPKDLTVKLENLGEASSSFTVELVQKTPLSEKDSPFSGSLKKKTSSFRNSTVDLTFLTENRFKVELNVPDVAGKGSKVKVLHDFGLDQYDGKLSPSFEYKNDKVNLSVGLDAPYTVFKTDKDAKAPAPKFNFALVGKVTDGLFGGANAVVLTNRLESASGRFQYQAPSFTLNVFGDLKIGKENERDLTQGVSLYTPLSLAGNAAKVGVQVTRGKELNLAAGVESALNSASTLKAKFDLKGNVSTSLVHQLTPYAKLTGATQFNLKTKTPATYGLTVALSDK